MTRWRPRAWPLTLRGAGMVLIGITCFVFARELGVIELAYLGSFLLALPAAGLAVMYVGPRAGSAARVLRPAIVPVGASIDVRVRFRRLGLSASLPLRWRDALPPGLDGLAMGRVPGIAAHRATDTGHRAGETEIEYSARAVRRGIWSIGPLRLRSTDAFGLACRAHRAAGETRVVATPALVALPPAAIGAGERGGVPHSAANQLGQGSDNLIARPYVAGDSMRRVHWRATARRDTLMVRQEEPDDVSAATVLCDLSAARWSPVAQHGTGADPAFEAALTTCLSIALRLADDGYRVDVADTDGTPLCDTVSASDADRERSQKFLPFAGMTTRGDDTLPGLSKRYAGARGPLVIITGLFRPADAESLAALPARCNLPILLAAAPSADALERAARAGWRTAAIGADIDLAGVWSEVCDRGMHRVGV